MKSYKKIIILILLFLSVLLIKNKALALTLNPEDYYNYNDYLEGLTPLKLQTTTNSYIVEISKDFKTIRVCESYDRDSYLVSLFSSDEISGTYNTIRSYNSALNSLSDICCYTATYDSSTCLWSDWTSSFLTNSHEFAPRQ